MNLSIRINTVCLLLSVFLGISAFAADAKSAPVKDPKTEEAIWQIEMDIADAAVKGKFSKLEQFMTADYVNVTDEGQLQNAEETIKELKDGTLKLTKYDVSNLNVRSYGDVAIAIYVATVEGTYKGDAFAVKFATTDVFRRVGGEWKAISSHSCKVTKPD